jgi:ketosteroid isomerase-like protein
MMENETAKAIRAAFDAYEAALMSNDADALSGFFWRDPRAVRLSADGGLYGYDEISAFRAKRDVSDIARDLLRVEILVLAPDLGVANAEYRRRNSGGKGAQSQVWKKFEDGWRIVAAHVSLAAG